MQATAGHFDVHALIPQVPDSHSTSANDPNIATEWPAGVPDRSAELTNVLKRPGFGPYRTAWVKWSDTPGGVHGHTWKSSSTGSVVGACTRPTPQTMA